MLQATTPLTSALPSTRRRARRAFPLVLLLAICVLLFLAGVFLLTRGDAPKPRQQIVQQITMIQEEPPPPPPPEEKIVEPKEVLKPIEQAQVQEDVEQVSEDPSPEPATAEPAGLNRPADIGADSFRLAAGKGGGLFGRGGGGGGSWDAFVATHIRKALQNDPRTRSASGYLEVLLSIDAQGRFERAELQSSTGDSELDIAIREVLSALPPLSRGRPPNVSAIAVTGINLRAAQR